MFDRFGQHFPENPHQRKIEQPHPAPDAPPEENLSMAPDEDPTAASPAEFRDEGIERFGEVPARLEGEGQKSGPDLTDPDPIPSESPAPDDKMAQHDTPSPSEPDDVVESPEPGTTRSSRFYGDIELLLQAGRIDQFHVHHQSELFRYDTISTDELEGEARKKFTPPVAGFEELEESVYMRKRHVILLAAEQGGHDFAARILATAVDGLTPLRIRPGADPRVAPWQLKKKRKSAWLLNLTDTELEDRRILLEHFAGLRDDLEEQGSILIVVFNSKDLTDSQIHDYGVVALKRPDPFVVLDSHLTIRLREAGVPLVEGLVAHWVAFANRRRLIVDAVPSEAVRLSDAIVYAIEDYWRGLSEEDRKQFKQGFERDHARLEAVALDSFQAWEAELDSWNAASQAQPRLRAFQLAAAVLPSGDPVRIRTEASAFLERIGSKGVRNDALSGPGTRQLTKEIGAELRDGKVVFTRPGFDEAVVRYFWDDWPEHQGELLDWLMAIVMGAANEKESDVDVRQLKDRIGRFALRHALQRGTFDFLYTVISRWSNAPNTLDDAAALLEKAATASGIARPVREKTRQWAKGGDPGLRRAVAKLCASETFAPSHPTLVVGRLRHLMDGRAAGEEDPVLDALLQQGCQILVTATHRSGAVLERLSGGLKSDRTEHRERTARLFLSIAQAKVGSAVAPALVAQLSQAESFRDETARLWGAVLRLLKVEQVQPAFNAWMEACEPPGTEALVLDVFGNAVGTDPFEAGDVSQKGAQLSLVWKSNSALPPNRIEAIDEHLLVVLRDRAAEAAAKRRQPREPYQEPQ